MNIFILIMIIFSFLGLIDKSLGNKLHLGQSFDQGLAMMGTIALSVAGFFVAQLPLFNAILFQFNTYHCYYILNLVS